MVSRSASSPRKFVRPARNQTGRPPELNRVLDTTPTGEPITVHDRIIQAIRAGNYVETAAAAVGVDKYILHGWMRRGALMASARIAQPDYPLTDFDQDCITFNQSVARAEAEWEIQEATTLERLARGGHETVIRTVKTDAQGNITETVTRTETHGASAAALMWRLERRFPDRYSARTEITGPRGGPVPVETRAQSLIDALSAIDAMSHPATPALPAARDDASDDSDER
jgi:hypothetical protein